MHSTEVAIIGAGPAGLAAAVESARAGASTVVIDSNLHAGGQLIKQIHKFFGSKEHMAGIRGVDIASRLADQAGKYGAEIWLDSAVHFLDSSGRMEIVCGGLTHAGRPEKMRNVGLSAQRIIIATGAQENPIAFPGWTLPGVLGAGAAQTLVNVHRVLPGEQVLVVGSGNVGLIVAYQLLQAGAEVPAIVEAAPQIGGYGVHSAKVSRANVPILTSCTVKCAHGDNEVEGATIVRLDKNWDNIKNSERQLEVDTICIAAGLHPEIKLARMAGCKMSFVSTLGGWAPTHDDNMQTTIPAIYIAGDVSGVEEASTAMEEGRLAGLAVVDSLGLIDSEFLETEKRRFRTSLSELRKGSFGERRKQAKAQLMRARIRA